MRREGFTRKKRISMSIGNEIEQVLDAYGSISLPEVEKASLMRRKDSKYIMNVLNLPDVLASVMEHYRVLTIDGKRSHGYCTHYYDTPDLEMYHLHHRGKANRHKVRFRRYGTSDIHFLEVKRKNSKGVTVKNRIRTNGMHASILTTEEEFLHTHTPYHASLMKPVLENQFNRITLVRHDQRERITLDYGLRFSSMMSDRELNLPGLSIAEIKYEHLLSGSPFNLALKKDHIVPDRFSKYAIGAALLNGELKQNRFKMKVRKVLRINEQYSETIKTPQDA
jgi:hypothetical protein